MNRVIALGALTLASLLSGCATIEKTAGGLYEAFFPGANFDPKKYEALAFDYATSPSAAAQNRHKNIRFNAYYFGVTGNVAQREILSQNIYVTLCEDRRRRQCATKVAVHDLNSKEVTSIPRGTPVTFYGRVGEVQAIEYGNNLSVTNRDGTLNNAIFFLTAHKILPR
jgi:hypothetical protein